MGGPSSQRQPLLIRRRGALLASVLYALLAGLYIWLSGRLVLFLADGDQHLQNQLEVLKGWLFVLLTTVALYALLRLVHRQTVEREGAERLGAEMGARFRTLVELSPDAILIHQDGVIKFANAAAARLWGAASPEELVGTPALELVAPAFRSAVRERVRRSLQEGVVAPPLVEEFLRLDGSTFRGEATAAPLTFQGRPAMEVIIRDVTERERANIALLSAQKLEAIGALAGGLAHDLNNLFQAFGAVLFATRQKAAQGQNPEEELTSLQQLVSQGASLTRQLLLFARRGTSKREHLELGRFLADSKGLLRHLLPENIALELATPPEPLVVEVDANQLQQVILNLVLNARDAMPEGGRLLLRLIREGDQAVLEVRDTGCGIPEDILPRIFEPFFSTKGLGGTGLGLAVVHGIATGHGGRVEVESQVGQGSTFRVFLPVSSRTPEAPPPAHKLEAAAHPAGLRLLLVEDDEEAREALSQVLRSLGYQVTAVANAEEAGRLPAEPPYHILLTDFLLPGANGAQVAAGLVERWPSLAVVVMSGYTEDKVFNEQVLAGQVRFLPKPFTIEKLAQELAAALAEKGG